MDGSWFAIAWMQLLMVGMRGLQTAVIGWILPLLCAHSVFPQELPAPLLEESALSSKFEPRGDEIVRRDDQVLAPSQIPAALAWWEPQVRGSLKPSTAQIPLDVNSLLIDALRYSARIRAISDNAVIAETAIMQTAAEFDPTTFMESKFVRTSVPTGSSLDAGFNVARLREEDWFTRGGVRRKTTSGGNLELSQRIGLKDSNSNFFLPDNQGNSRLSLSYSHPFLRGAGKCYNTNLIVLAKIDTEVAIDRTKSELQDQLLEVVEAMWDLYLQRALLVQRQTHVQRAEIILDWLESRQDLDALMSQVARARAAVAVRKTQLIRTVTMVSNAESKLRSLVNWPNVEGSRGWELIPIESPMTEPVPLNVNDTLVTALQNRQEVDAAAREIEAARVKLNVAKNELLPVLNGVVESYVSGLRGDFGIGRSLVDQFSTGEPAYTAGVLFEVPWGRRAANANHQRRMAELRQLSSKFEATVAALNAEVEIAVREVETTYQELQAKRELVLAAQADTTYLHKRWESLPGDERSASFLLEDLLDSQDRLASAEAAYSQAPVDYTLSLVRLNRSMGTLLQEEKVEMIRGSDNCVPNIHFERGRFIDPAAMNIANDGRQAVGQGSPFPAPWVPMPYLEDSGSNGPSPELTSPSSIMLLPPTNQPSNASDTTHSSDVRMLPPVEPSVRPLPAVR